VEVTVREQANRISKSRITRRVQIMMTMESQGLRTKKVDSQMA